METLINESQNADENSKRYEVEMFTSLLEEIKTKAGQGINAFFIT